MAQASPTLPVSASWSMNLRCLVAVQPARRLRVGAGVKSGSFGGATMSATSSTTLSLVALGDSFG
jgi:hypothetical protein